MRVRWQRWALADLRAVRIYLDPRSPRATARILSRIRETTDGLTLFPLSAPALMDVPSLRRLVVTGTPYVVYYSVRDDVISIEALFHRAQDRPI